jgi:hypothetical protein
MQREPRLADTPPPARQLTRCAKLEPIVPPFRAGRRGGPRSLRFKSREFSWFTLIVFTCTSVSRTPRATPFTSSRQLPPRQDAQPPVPRRHTVEGADNPYHRSRILRSWHSAAKAKAALSPPPALLGANRLPFGLCVGQHARTAVAGSSDSYM